MKALKGRDMMLSTDRGEMPFAAGDHIQINKTDKSLGLINGMFGRAVSVTEDHLEVKLDGGRTVHIDPKNYGGFSHGYAGTIYKGQGRTIDETYLMHSFHWKARASYVALTRQKHHARIFVSRQNIPDVEALAKSMGRPDFNRVSVEYSEYEA